MYVDSHAHIDFPQFDGDREMVIARAWEAGVRTIIIPGVDRESSLRGQIIAEGYPHIWFSAGWHPHDADKLDMSLLTRLAGHPKCAAIGEIGLDYYRDLSPRDVQEKAFRAQIEYALRVDLPVIIHIRDAWGDAKRIVGDYDGLRAVFHAFSGGEEELDWAVERGFHIGLGGPITFNNFKKANVVAKVPPKLLLTETDCPYLAPQSRRGKRNEPSFIPEILAELVRTMGIPADELAKRIEKNLTALFRIPTPRYSNHPEAAKKSFSQNFMVDKNMARKIATTAGEGKVCVEIGSGNGELTGFLREKFARLYAIEPDWDRIENLQRDVSDAIIIPKKSQDVDIRGIEIYEGTAVNIVGNLPYGETTPILFALLDHRKSIWRMTVLTQKEFAARLSANPGSKSYGIPSVLFSAFYAIIEEFDIPPQCFNPSPSVESTLISLIPLEEPLIEDSEFEAFKKVVKAAFAHRRKTISNSMQIEMGDSDVKPLLDMAGIAHSTRAEKIPPESYARLAKAFIEMGGE